MRSSLPSRTWREQEVTAARRFGVSSKWRSGALICYRPEMDIASMSSDGRLTVPAAARKALGLAGETEFEVEVDPDQDAIILRPAVLLRREDAWAYTPEHRSVLARAHADSRKGRVKRVTEEELSALAPTDPL